METYAQILNISLCCREDGLNFEPVPTFGANVTVIWGLGNDRIVHQRHRDSRDGRRSA